MPSCLIVASHFPPFQSAGVFRTVRIAKYLPGHGWEVDVLTLDPNAYLANSNTASDLLEQLPTEINIHRTTAKHPHQWIAAVRAALKRSKTPTTPKQNGNGGASASRNPSSPSVGQKIKDAITLPLMTPDRWIGWLPFATRTGKQLLKHKPVDVIYSSGPPWTNHLVAQRLQLATGTPWVADFRDPWLGNNFRPHRQGDNWAGRRHQMLEKKVIESAEIVIVNTDRALDAVRSRYPQLSEDKFQVIPNGFDPADFSTATDELSQPSGSSDPGRRLPLRIVHTGGFYGKRNVDALLHAVADLIEEERLQRSDLQIELVGAARPRRTHESDIAAAREITDIVKILPRMPHEECLQQMRQADVLLLVQTEAPLCVPGKLYEYIAIGKPILTLAGSGATADIVNEQNLGPCVDPAETNSLKNCLCELVKQHQSDTLPRPSGSAVDRFDGRALMQRFDSAFHAAIQSRSNNLASESKAGP